MKIAGCLQVIKQFKSIADLALLIGMSFYPPYVS